eukprot:TRINITY_DN56559_c0_g1_i1.p1 TRINITY_DN56559_c0_g1~~TRINITY_DN56559_c0_g1_i1.p1  ORF type:complete len:407 (-),score=67.74 TRINITY_DN56559_c0_g1_i1:84-1214(-)
MSGKNAQKDSAPLPPLTSFSPPLVFQKGGIEPLTREKLLKRADAATQPIYASTGEGSHFKASHPDYAATWPAKLEHPPPPVHDLMKPGKTGSFLFSEIIVCVFAPPLVFSYVSWLVTFKTHFDLQSYVWLPVSLAFAPVISAWWKLRREAPQRHDKVGGHRLQMVLVLIAVLTAAVSSDFNYWNCMYPIYSLRSMKSYTDIDPAETLGQRVMDAATITFVNESRVATDLAMSYTTWETYCVAPIATGSLAERLQQYDFWAVGVGCCYSGAPSFHCGEYNNVKARSGLRLTDPEQLHYFQLAVQQAEAEYAIEAPHPIFIHWVEDPVHEEVVLYQAGVQMWVMASSLHLGFNLFAIAVYFTVFHRPSRKPRSYDLAA